MAKLLSDVVGGDKTMEGLSYWLATSAWLLALLRQHGAQQESLVSPLEAPAGCRHPPTAGESSSLLLQPSPARDRQMWSASVALQGSMINLFGHTRGQAMESLMPILDALMEPTGMVVRAGSRPIPDEEQKAFRSSEELVLLVANFLSQTRKVMEVSNFVIATGQCKDSCPSVRCHGDPQDPPGSEVLRDQ